MGTSLDTSERCELFERIAKSVWDRITRAHGLNVNLSEDGITRDIIVDILDYHQSPPNFDVYVKPGWDENTYGSDMDLFIETHLGKYKWIALQAKILKKNNLYTTLRDGYNATNPTYQWDKLILLEAVSGCEAYYLLYNGDNNFSIFTHNHTTLTDICGRTYLAEQLGCSIVKVADIKTFGLRKNASGTRYQNPTFDEIHPTFSQPWRILICCYHEINDNTILYSEDQIINSNGSRHKADFVPESDIEIPEKEFEEDFNPDNPISIAMREANWSPSVRVVVHRTDNLEM